MLYIYNTFYITNINNIFIDIYKIYNYFHNINNLECIDYIYKYKYKFKQINNSNILSNKFSINY